ncbi:imidazole glycerol phosphate synthase subunit HisF [Eupransor demetentiae]|uniref:Imidazole glycerol phosphate synthase subunit HisF n=1 Tax=Eupransor demetentiae TaxID=3109584 RepID=A0ABM9N379_9LACO|nr:Imidazole glycerol phosphate synthase subunit HisF (HisF) [Lactobacillaceae bacterium LMG 33000]
MTLNKRIIPALDIKNGRVVKGIQFQNVQAVGDPVAIAKEYQDLGADELVLLDISASQEDRKTAQEVVDDVSSQVFIPLTVGGGISSLADMKKIIQAGADKIFLNSAAVKQVDLVTQGAEVFGSQAMVVAIDVKWDVAEKSYRVYIKGGQEATDWEVGAWAQAVVKAGAGELLVTSMDADGTKQGYDIALYQYLCQQVDVPIIASGGAGKIEDFEELFLKTDVDGALAASVFHYKQIAIADLKAALQAKGVPVRC